MLLSADQTLLIAIDIQERLLPAIHDGSRVQRNADILLQAANILQIPALLTEQYPKGLGRTVPQIRSAAGDSPVLEKMHFSAWRDDAIRAHIETLHRPSVVIAGVEAHVCVLQTALDMAGTGLGVTVVADAISSRHPDSMRVACDRMVAAGITLATTEMCLFEWLGTASHPAFKTLSALIK
ncbi:MAG: hydrolase [Alphaproteobacteria bacterium]|nr:hydrolase [Alphaproteobacteria bacterium]